METFKTIRKIILILSGVSGAGVFIFYMSEGGIQHINQAIRFNSSPWKEPLQMLALCVAQFIFFVIFFKFVLMLIEAVKKDTGKMKVFSDKQYLEAYSEVEENNIQNKELWAKAFAQCGGDKEKQKSIYVELRMKELSKG